jgi:hypothetical protein
MCSWVTTNYECWLLTHNYLSSKLLLALASTGGLGFGPCRTHDSYFSVSQLTNLPHWLLYKLCMDPVENTTSSSSSIIVYASTAAGTCLPSHQLEMAFFWFHYSSFQLSCHNIQARSCKYDDVHLIILVLFCFMWIGVYLTVFWGYLWLWAHDCNTEKHTGNL